MLKPMAGGISGMRGDGTSCDVEHGVHMGI